MTVIVGIAGISCAGKSTLSGYLAKKLSARHINMDSYWINNNNAPMVNGVLSFERPDQYDLVKFLEDVENELQNQPSFLVLEGFLLFTYPEVYNLVNHHFFISIPEEVSMQRRRDRALKGGLAPWGMEYKSPEKDQWFHNGISEWQLFGAKQVDLDKVKVLDGLKPTQDIYEELVGEIEHKDNIGLSIPSKV